MMEANRLEPSLLHAAASIELLLVDCDGVLTDGRLYFSADGEAMKAFHVHDGQGIANWHRSGYRSGIITGRSSAIARSRAEELGMEFFLDHVSDKSLALDELVEKSGVEKELIAYIGDDVADIPVMKRVGLAIAVNNCAEELRSEAALVTSKNGGEGAVREVVDLLLGAKVLVKAE